MNVGAAQIEITPDRVVELSGFAARVQPSIGVLDPIFAKCLYLEDGDQQLLWANLDVVALDRGFLESFRTWAHGELNLGADQVLVSATHTHSAPATVRLSGCGEIDVHYVNELQAELRSCALQAVAKPQAAEMVVCEARVDLAIDRRAQATAHTDSQLLSIGWHNARREFIAALMNYPMHPVTLGAENRLISGDWCGRAADALSRSLPAQPITLVTNGACGNLNPPVRGTNPKLIDKLGRTLADPVSNGLINATAPAFPALWMRRVVVDLPLETLSIEDIDVVADRQLSQDLPDANWKKSFHDVIETWRATRKSEVQAGRGQSAPIELHAVRLGSVYILAVTGEIFSRFTDELRRRTGKTIYIIGYANGLFGYIPTLAAYDEGGYEPNLAHFFYDSFRARRGGLEVLVDRAAELLSEI
jgi:hypothetical protein